MAGEERTENATPKKLREARKRGDVPSSPEVTAAIMGVVSVLVLQQQGANMLEGMAGIASQGLAASGTSGSLGQNSLSGQIRTDLVSGMALLVPFGVTMIVAGLAIGAANTRGLLSPHGLKPSFRKLNPLNNLKNMFGKSGLGMLGKALVKLAVVVVVVRSWQSHWEQVLPQLSQMQVGPATSQVWGDTIQVALQILAGFAVIGAVDYFFRFRAWRKRMRMTKEEVKQEFKSSEGNPQVKSRMRQIGRRRLREILSGGLRAVPTADVVITNPTHYAIAIQYQPGKMRAPRVIAKGQRLFAQRIKEIARKHNIPIVENKPLAQALFKSVKPGQEIPGDLYQAVAQVLAFVYRLRGVGRAPRISASPAGQPGRS